MIIFIFFRFIIKIDKTRNIKNYCQYIADAVIWVYLTIRENGKLRDPKYKGNFTEMALVTVMLVTIKKYYDKSKFNLLTTFRAQLD